MQKEHHNSTRRSISSRRQTKKPRHRIEVSAGGLVFKRTSRGIVFAMLKDSYGNWTFPKGHVKKGESRGAAAKREINEEMGLEDLELLCPLGQIDIWFRDRFVFKGKMVHKFIHFFLFEAPSNAPLSTPPKKEKGERIETVAWVSIKGILDRSAYKDTKPIIRKALAHIKEKG